MKPFRFPRLVTTALLVAPLALLAVSMPMAAAQGIGAKAGTPVVVAKSTVTQTYGTQDSTSTAYGAGDFSKPSNTVTWSTSATVAEGIQVWQTAGPQVDWWQEVRVPNGAVIDSLELEACDNSASGAAIFGLTQGLSPASTAGNVTPVATTGDSATPGCGFFSVTPTAPPLVADNGNSNLWIFLDYSDFSGAVVVNALRVFYHLQVSPAPVTPTFGDVDPSNIFYQYIEALAAAGITSGCDLVPNYCPDRPITRAEMAVFMSRALGLHFPN